MVLGTLILFGWCVSQLAPDSANERSSVSTTRSFEPVLEVGRWSWRQEYGYAIAEGVVKNISSKSLSNVEAVVTFEDKAGQFITSDSALVEYNPILPGQASPWKVLKSWNPAMKNARVEFKTLFGEALVTREQRK